jgi:hypothetical protein
MRLDAFDVAVSGRRRMILRLDELTIEPENVCRYGSSGARIVVTVTDRSRADRGDRARHRM